MMLVAFKMLVGDRLKYLGLIAGMTFAAMMIAQQASIFAGLSAQTGTFIREIGDVDLWVMDPQVRFSEDMMALPEITVQRVKSIAGVAWAAPLFKGFLKCRLPDGTRSSLILVGVDDATLVGGPHTFADGDMTRLRQDPGILIDERDAGGKLALIRQNNQPLRVGDHLSINDNDAAVVGTYRGTPSFFWDPVVYTTYSRALRFAPKERNLLCFVLVKCKAGADVDAVRRAIQETIGYTARTGPEFEKATSAYILKSTGILVNFGLAVGLGFIIGLLVTGQTFFNFTLDNLRYFAALKAMGASASSLVKMVLVQVLSVTWLSFGLGVGLAALMGLFITSTDLAFLMRWEVLAITGLLMFLVASLSALLSLYKVLRLEPASVFKA